MFNVTSQKYEEANPPRFVYQVQKPKVQHPWRRFVQVQKSRDSQATVLVDKERNALRTQVPITSKALVVILTTQHDNKY